MASRRAETLSGRLAQGKAGIREFEQIVSVLFRRFLDSLGKGDEPITQLRQGLLLGSRTLCVSYPPLSPVDLAGLLADERLPLSDGHREGLQTVLLAILDPIRGQARIDSLPPELEQAFGERASKKLHLRVWDAETLLNLLAEIPSLCLRYYPGLVPNGKNRLKRILSSRASYDQELAKLNGEIQFVGMSVYKEEASSGIEMEKIYIPLRVVPEGATGAEAPQSNPLTLLEPGARRVILGDPGSGKSTLLRFLALAGSKPQLLRRYGARKDDRLPILVTLRHFAEELKGKPDLDLLDYVVQVSRTSFDLPALDRELFEYHLYAGQGMLFFDGVDELPTPEMKVAVRQRIAQLLDRYPGNTILVTSRIVGYDKEARFDDLGFSHHRIAPLNLNDIQTFVHDWYRARIASKAERLRHARDLVNVLCNPDSRAIRELAENPLLLTIICLVHRIDAELPDERVVLYQKCTETLLNTWHIWKFQRENVPSRNKVERRNRSRMEAIAHWMHASLEAKEKVRRAIVPYQDLLKFLTQYIEEIERPRDEDPTQLAGHFLRFVKEQAGLLIEIGSDQYSFVHLTFQEYLTATFLRKSGEKGGMAVVWQFIKDRCGDPKWHEVIRLLVGALEREESQAFLLERILPDMKDEKPLERALLAGGCLLDGVDAASEMQDEILAGLLAGAASAASLASLRRALRMLQIWLARDDSHHRQLGELASRIQSGSREQELGLALSLSALGWTQREVSRVTCQLGDMHSREGKTFLICCAEEPQSARLSATEEEAITASLTAMSLFRPVTNLVASFAFPALSRGAAPPFLPMLSCALNPTGPFLDLIANSLLIARRSGSLHGKMWTRARALDLDRARALDRALDRAGAGDRALHRAGDRARDRARALDRARISSSSDLLASVLEDETLHGPVLDLLCDFLKLSPRAHWWEVLRIQALPRTPGRITLVDPEVWERTLISFREKRADELALEHAASQLLLDVWLWLVEHHDRPDDSPFAELATLTRHVESAPLRVAHCLRDIAYGDESRVAGLEAMVQSRDSVYRKLFEDAFWRDPGKATERPRSTKRR